QDPLPAAHLRDRANGAANPGAQDRGERCRDTVEIAERTRRPGGDARAALTATLVSEQEDGRARRRNADEDPSRSPTCLRLASQRRWGLTTSVRLTCCYRSSLGSYQQKIG